MHEIKHGLLYKITKLPKLMIAAIILVCCYGFVLLYSAAGGDLSPWSYKQILVFVGFVPITLLIALSDLRIIYNWSYLIYLISVLIVVVVTFFGKSAMGATRWLDLGVVSIQPSELLKISLVLMLAKYFHTRTQGESDWYLLIPIAACLFPILLVIKQPDLGTGMIALIVVISMFFAAGVEIKYFIVMLIASLISAPVLWSVLHTYQQNRILTFLYPERDPLGTGYNIIQSKIAIGSGGFWGKGLLSGTQSHLNFLPEYQTDFIFSFLMEELGFVGGMGLLMLYAIILISILKISVNCKSKFASLISLGIAVLFFSHVFINIAMVMGLVPVVGVPLPLVSYGRTMMASMLIGLGLVMNASINQQKKL